MDAPHADDPLANGTDVPQRVLLFRFGVEQYGIRLAEIGGVASCGAIREIPGAPACVLGLTEWRGSVLAVLDLPRLLDRDPPGDPPCLIRLGPPMEQTALFLPATVQLVERPPAATDAPEGPAAEPAASPGADALRLVQPLELVRRLEREIRGGL